MPELAAVAVVDDDRKDIAIAGRRRLGQLETSVVHRSPAWSGKRADRRLAPAPTRTRPSSWALGQSRVRLIAAVSSVAVCPGPRSSQPEGTRIVPRSTGLTIVSGVATASASNSGR